MSQARKGVTDKTTKIVEMQATQMKEPKALFVSLVRHGANQEPFVVVKSQTEGGENAVTRRVVQRVIVSKDLAKEEADAALKGFLTGDEKEYETHLAYDQVEKTQCVPDSFEGVKLDADGKVFAITAVLKEGATVPEGVQEISTSKEQKEGSDSTDVQKVAIPWDIGYDISDEMYSMIGIISGAIHQSSAGKEWVINTIKQAYSNFESYLGMTLDSISTEGVDEKALKKHLARKLNGEVTDDSSINANDLSHAIEGLVTRLVTIKESISAPDENGGTTEEESMFKNADEAKAFVASVIKEVKTAEMAETQAREKAAADAAEKKQLTDALTALTEKVATLTTEIETLKGKATTPSGTAEAETEAETAAAAETPEEKTQKGNGKAKFTGLLFQREKGRAGLAQ